jgi:hypothetical protein
MGVKMTSNPIPFLVYLAVVAGAFFIAMKAGGHDSR